MIIAVALLALVPLSPSQVPPADRTFHIIASSFEFSPAEIAVNPGDHVTIEFTSTDVVHGFYLDGYGLQIEADPGQTTKLAFTADRSGAFRFRCSITCGDLHPFMIGKLRVGSNTLFWRGVGLALLAFLGLIFTTRSLVRQGIP